MPRLVKMVVLPPKRKGRVAAAVASALTRTMKTAIPRTRARFAAMKAGSISIPTETKNSVAKRLRIGTTSATTRWSNSVSASSSPAMNAPRAGDRPSSALSVAVPSARATAVSRNSDGGQVLHDQHAEQDAPVAGSDLAAVEQRLEDHHRAADGDDAAEEQPLRRRPAEHRPESGAGDDRQGYLDSGADQGDAPDASQFPEGELDPERE